MRTLQGPYMCLSCVEAKAQAAQLAAEEAAAKVAERARKAQEAAQLKQGGRRASGGMTKGPKPTNGRKSNGSESQS